jgi:protein involved in polysaccharide export with SLBB domain
VKFALVWQKRLFSACATLLIGALVALSCGRAVARVAAPPACPATSSLTPLRLPIPAAQNAPAVLHVGDAADVIVYNHPELSTRVTVAADSTITVPLVPAPIPAASATAEVVAQRIADQLASVINKPYVEVRPVVAPASVTFTDQASGNALLVPGATLATALGAAKIAPAGDLQQVRVTRGGVIYGPFDLTGLGPQDAVALQAGDVVDVPRKPCAVVVDGAVTARAVAYLAATEPLGDALKAATLSADADPTRIVIRRAGAVCACDLTAPAQPGDELTIEAAVVTAVLGSVGKAGVVTLRGNVSVSNALALAGGPGKTADLTNVLVLDTNGNTIARANLVAFAKTGDPKQNPPLATGQVLFVPEQHPKIDILVAAAAALVAIKVLLKTKLP